MRLVVEGLVKRFGEVTAVDDVRFQRELHASFTRERNAGLVAEVDRAEAQAIFIGCTNFRTL